MQILDGPIGEKGQTGKPELSGETRPTGEPGPQVAMEQPGETRQNGTDFKSCFY